MIEITLVLLVPFEAILPCAFMWLYLFGVALLESPAFFFT
jgi:hypothetical protein